MTEDQLEQETLGWLTELGYAHLYGPDIAHDGDNPERESYRDVLLTMRLRTAIARLNPQVPLAAREDALRQVLELGVPVQLSANRLFHRLLVSGVPVQYQKDGETRGDFVRLIDWADVRANEWLAVNQFSIQGPKHTRRPDIILFVNGLPLVLLELKNPADLNADIWKAFEQIQTYKEQIPDVFQYNEILVISDGSEARMGSLSADAERFARWRTIDGETVDPLGEFNELETLVRGVLQPAMLLDYLRYFVLFEDDGRLVKKIAGYHQFHAVRAAIQQVVNASRPGGSQKGGVVWHTQGSGKSITMTCFAARVMQEAAMENPTIVVITLCCTLDEAKAVREEVAFLQAIKVILTKREISQKKKTDEERELAIRQIIGNAVVSGEVVDVFEAVGLDKPNIGLLDDEFLAEVRNLPEKNLAVELLERLLEGEIKSRYSSNLAQEKKFSEMLDNVIKRYQNRSIETAQVIEELIEMAKKFAAASKRGEQLGLNDDELAFYDALANNESSVRDLGDETLAKIAHELTDSLRQNVTVDWSNRDSVRAKLRLLVKRILRKYKYPPDQQEEAAQLVLAQAETLCQAWM